RSRGRRARRAAPEPTAGLRARAAETRTRPRRDRARAAAAAGARDTVRRTHVRRLPAGRDASARSDRTTARDPRRRLRARHRPPALRLHLAPVRAVAADRLAPHEPRPRADPDRVHAARADRADRAVPAVTGDGPRPPHEVEHDATLE